MHDREDLARLLAEQLYDRGEYVPDWPEDEKTLHRDHTAWTDFADRETKVQALRFQKAADAVLREFLVVPRSDITDPIAAELLPVPVGFVVLAKRPDRHEKDAFRYEVAGSIWPTREPVENHQAYCEGTAAADPERYRGVEYVTGEVREVPDGP
jgi:hypothetical protein